MTDTGDPYKRDHKGRWAAGTAPGPGRPKAVLGPALLAALPVEEWAALVAEQARAGNARALEIYAERQEGKAPQTLIGDLTMRSESLDEVAERVALRTNGHGEATT